MTLRDILWPRTCAGCGRAADRPDRYLCSECLMRLPLVSTDGLCRCCGREAVEFTGDFLCEDCRRYKPAFDRAVSALRFEGVARDLVNGFKFREQLYLRDDLVDILEGAVRARFRLTEVECLVPMPSTVAHRFWRGYNQCAYLARALSERLGVPCRELVRRTGSPRRQGGLTEADRRTNVVGTFAPARGLVKNDLPTCALVVDDIMTTGSTLSECAKTLKDAGLSKVYAATLARSIRL